MTRVTTYRCGRTNTLPCVFLVFNLLRFSPPLKQPLLWRTLADRPTIGGELFAYRQSKSSAE